LTDTTPGSSGSPAFNRFWQVVALHHSGVPKKDSRGRTLTKDGKVWDSSMDETEIDWIANEGVRVSSIVTDLKVQMGAHPLMKPGLDQSLARVPSERALAAAGVAPRGPDLWIEQSGDTASLVIPVRVPLPTIAKGFAPPAIPDTKPIVPPAI